MTLSYFDVIIPPFTTVKLVSKNISSATARDMCAIFTGKVGMAQRVGNLVE